MTSRSKLSRPADPYAQTAALRRQLDEFMAEARRNERKLRRFQSYELRLISLSSLFELVQAVIYPDHTTFHWDMVTLLLVDPEYEIRRILESEGVYLDDHPSLMFANSWSELDALYSYSLFPALGPYRPGKHSKLFPQSRPKPESVALLPLVRYGKLIGSLNIGSYSSERFVRGTLTDFFEHFAAVVAICIENAVNLQRLKRQGITDTLTAVNNRRFFDQRLKEEVEVARRNLTPLSCMLLDVDHFKQVNDTYGHQVGDQVLRDVAAIIRGQLRGGDVLARYGGEEFAALLARTEAPKAEEVAERVRNAIAEYKFSLPDGTGFQVTISIGLATFKPREELPAAKLRGEMLIGHSDRSLYEAKSAGRNRVVSAGNISLVEPEPW